MIHYNILHERLHELNSTMRDISLKHVFLYSELVSICLSSRLVVFFKFSKFWIFCTWHSALMTHLFVVTQMFILLHVSCFDMCKRKFIYCFHHMNQLFVRLFVDIFKPLKFILYPIRLNNQDKSFEKWFTVWLFPFVTNPWICDNSKRYIQKIIKHTFAITQLTTVRTIKQDFWLSNTQRVQKCLL
jgi:hypothetical protein